MHWGSACSGTCVASAFFERGVQLLGPECTPTNLEAQASVVSCVCTALNVKVLLTPISHNIAWRCQRRCTRSEYPITIHQLVPYVLHANLSPNTSLVDINKTTSHRSCVSTDDACRDGLLVLVLGHDPISQDGKPCQPNHAFSCKVSQDMHEVTLAARHYSVCLERFFRGLLSTC